jgi:L-2-amino-4-chloropent-4-enoate dechlorinase/desaturase
VPLSASSRLAIRSERKSCGARLPDSVHAVSVSLPTLDDLVRYERQDPDILALVRSGYPRFHVHEYLKRLALVVPRASRARPHEVLFFPSERCAIDACNHANLDTDRLRSWRGINYLPLEDLKDDPIRQARSYQQHTGTILSSRHAEDLLIAEGVIASRYAEQSHVDGAHARVRQALRHAYGDQVREERIYLANTGMNAMYAAARAIAAVQEPRGRQTLVEAGWLFMDTMKLVRLLAGKEKSLLLSSALSLEELASHLDEHPRSVAAVFTEMPSNPLLQTADFLELRRLAKLHGFIVVVDATLGTPWNVDALICADVVVESLTKYANGAADVMMGALIVSPSCPHGDEIAEQLQRFLQQPYDRDVQRLAFNIRDYGARMQKVNRTALRLVEFLLSRHAVKHVHWAYEAASRANYEAVQRQSDAPGGVITLELNVPLRSVYDRLQLPKGPSFGADFSLVGPYLYHAHYDLVSTEAGRQHLTMCGLDPDLLRVSIGLEEPDDLIAAFADVL